jgi:hypothetical protein
MPDDSGFDPNAARRASMTTEEIEAELNRRI